MLLEITKTFKGEGTREQRLGAIEALLKKDAETILTQCTEHGAFIGNNYLSFLPPFYIARQSAFFLFTETIPLASTTQDLALIDAIAFLIKNKSSRGRWISIENSHLNLFLVPDKLMMASLSLSVSRFTLDFLRVLNSKRIDYQIIEHVLKGEFLEIKTLAEHLTILFGQVRMLN